MAYDHFFAYFCVVLAPITPPIRPPAVAATDHGRLAPEPAAGVGLRERQPCAWAAGRAGTARGASGKGHGHRRGRRIARGL